MLGWKDAEIREAFVTPRLLLELRENQSEVNSTKSFDGEKAGALHQLHRPQENQAQRSSFLPRSNRLPRTLLLPRPLL